VWGKGQHVLCKNLIYKSNTPHAVLERGCVNSGLCDARKEEHKSSNDKVGGFPPLPEEDSEQPSPRRRKPRFSIPCNRAPPNSSGCPLKKGFLFGRGKRSAGPPQNPLGGKVNRPCAPQIPKILRVRRSNTALGKNTGLNVSSPTCGPRKHLDASGVWRGKKS